MLLHDFLRRKAAILAKAKADVDNLLTEISDPKTRAVVDDWEPGDPITDEYPQGDQKKEDAVKTEVVEATTHVIPEGVIGGLAPVNTGQSENAGPATATTETIGQNQADVGAQLNHQPEGQPQQQPASGNAPA
jgi:hypothetical protein